MTDYSRATALPHAISDIELLLEEAPEPIDADTSLSQRGIGTEDAHALIDYLQHEHGVYLYNASSILDCTPRELASLIAVRNVFALTVTEVMYGEPHNDDTPCVLDTRFRLGNSIGDSKGLGLTWSDIYLTELLLEQGVFPGGLVVAWDQETDVATCVTNMLDHAAAM